MAMNNWRARQIRQKAKGSVTAGKSKGDCCTQDPQKKFFYTHPHAFRHPQYAQWDAEIKARNNYKAGG